MNPCRHVTSHAQPHQTIRLLVVDPSRHLGRLVKGVIESDSEMTVIGTVYTLPTAIAFIQQFDPDVVLFNFEETTPNNLDSVAQLSALQSTRVVAMAVDASVTSSARSQVLSRGAVGFAELSTGQIQQPGGCCSDRFLQCVRDAARARFSRINTSSAPVIKSSVSAATLRRWRQQLIAAGSVSTSVTSIIAIGASTGGPLTLQHLFQTLRLRQSVALIAQHMPQQFVSKFAKRLDRSSRVPVAVATHGAELCPGHCYIAPGNCHMRIARKGSTVVSVLDDGPAVSGHRPSVDVLFDSVARVAGQRCVGVLLTGMGQDGASGLGNIKASGGITVAQDEASSTVWGMPGSALRAGATDTALRPEDIAHAISEIS